MTSEIFEHCNNQSTKIAKKVYNYINTDAITIVLENNGVYYFEFTNSTFGCAKYPTREVESYIHRYMKRRGFKYLYEYLM